MEWIDRMNQAIEYIELHLTQEIDYSKISQIACCSTYHFQRMFAFMANIPLSEYIRRRRMSLAAVDLQCTENKIIDIALKYGYSSPTAFNRAFQSVHGIAPSSARTEGTSLCSYPRISFTISIKGAEEMNYRIEKKESVRIIGVSHPLEKELEKNFEIVPKMWQTVSMNGTMEKLSQMMDAQPMGLLGITLYADDTDWKYVIGVASTKELSDNFEEFIIPAATWAIFPGSGTNQSIQELEKRIITEWLPTSGYEYANIADIEVYLNADPQNAKFEVWVPVIKKSI